jgi:hypothetical protein
MLHQKFGHLEVTVAGKANDSEDGYFKNPLAFYLPSQRKLTRDENKTTLENFKKASACHGGVGRWGRTTQNLKLFLFPNWVVRQNESRQGMGW